MTPPRTLGNASQRAPYIPTRSEPARANANQNRSIRSLTTPDTVLATVVVVQRVEVTVFPEVM